MTALDVKLKYFREKEEALTKELDSVREQINELEALRLKQNALAQT